MSRTLPTGFATACDAQKFDGRFYTEINWPSGWARAWSGYGESVLSLFDGVSYVDTTFYGVGLLGKISEIRESRDGTANGVSLELSGIPTAEIAKAMADDSQGRAGRIYFSPNQSVEPYLIFDGVIDVCPIDESGDTSSITVKLEKETVDRRTRGRRYTHEDQQLDYPGDNSFEYVAALAKQEISWGRVTAAGSSGGGGEAVLGNDEY